MKNREILFMVLFVVLIIAISNVSAITITGKASSQPTNVSIFVRQSNLSPVKPAPTPTGRCTTDWNCTEWGACSDGIQRRNCSKLKAECNVIKSKPSEEQNCLISPELPFIKNVTQTIISFILPELERPAPTPDKCCMFGICWFKFIFCWYWWILIVIILLILLHLKKMRHIDRRKKPYVIILKGR